jgi:hypothetical protein
MELQRHDSTDPSYAIITTRELVLILHLFLFPSECAKEQHELNCFHGTLVREDEPRRKEMAESPVVRKVDLAEVKEKIQRIRNDVRVLVAEGLEPGRDE